MRIAPHVYELSVRLCYGGRRAGSGLPGKSIVGSASAQGLVVPASACALQQSPSRWGRFLRAAKNVGSRDASRVADGQHAGSQRYFLKLADSARATLPEPAIDRQAGFAFLSLEAGLIVHIMIWLPLLGRLQRYEERMMVHQIADDVKVILDISP